MTDDGDTLAGARDRDAAHALKRRGLIAGVAALVTAVVARFGAQPAFAGVDGDVVLGVSNTTTTTSTVISTGAGDVLVGQSGASGTGAGTGVKGITGSGVGVFGQSATGYGVYGNATTSGYGVFGFSTGGFGVVGSSTNSVGLYGNSQTNFGLYGQSNSGIGLVGNSASNVGVYGQSTTGNAGQFVGPVVIQGDFSATGVKSAVVKHPDGTNRRLYCQESPESYFEDFGRAHMGGGHATVALDGEFAALVHTDDYDVFLTPYGNSNGLFVSKRTPTHFQVGEQQGGTSSLAFGYRIVAKRKDITGQRLEKVNLPAIPTLHVAPVNVSRGELFAQP